MIHRAVLYNNGTKGPAVGFVILQKTKQVTNQELFRGKKRYETRNRNDARK